MKKQAIVLMVYSFKENVKNLLKELDYENFDIFIHIDKKSDLTKDDFKNICTKSYIYIYKEINVKWAGVSQIECELFMFEQILNSNCEYSYVHILSGEDYPIASNELIFKFFNNSNKIYMDYGILNQKEEFKIRYYHIGQYLTNNRKIISLMTKVFVPLQKILFIRRKHNLANYKSATWNSITNEAIKYLVSKKVDILKYYKATYCSDELFLATFLVNSEYKDNIVKDNMRLIDWTRGNPYLFDKNDADMINSSHKLFARKINIEKNDLIKYLVRRNEL